MTTHPVNLLVRFLMELAMLGAFAAWGWGIHAGIALRIVTAIAAPAVGALVWGIFATPNDMVRSSAGPILVSGPLRLVIELVLFLAGAAALYAIGWHVAAAVYLAVIVVQNAVSYDRVRRLLN